MVVGVRAVAAAVPGAGSTVRVSVTAGGGQAMSTPGSAPAVSGNGRFVVFVSSSTAFGANPAGVPVVYRRDLVSNSTVAVSVTGSGGVPNGESGEPAVTPDGRFVAFWSRASDLVAGDTNGVGDVFVPRHGGFDDPGVGRGWGAGEC